MRLILNIFLIVFLIDGCVSLVDSILNMTAGISVLSGFRNIIAFITMAVSVIVYFLTGINKSIPKKLFFPLCFFLFWVLLTAQPVTILFSERSASLLLSLIQVLLVAVIFIVIKLKNSSWLISDRLLPSYAFSTKNTGLFFAGHFFLAPVILLVYFASSIQLGMYHKTSGFVRLATDGIYMKEKVYSKEGKTIRLIGMIHIGESDYYRNLEESLAKSNAVLLAEGVSDKQELLKHRFSTKGLAAGYDLASQEDMVLSGTYINEQDLDGNEDFKSTTGLSILHADVDTAAFDAETISFLNAIGEHVFKSASFAEGLTAYNQWLETNLSDSLIDNLRNDILDKRNDHVIGYLETSLRKFDTVAVPWGAMHMPAIEKAVKDLGFSVKNTHERLSIKFNYLKMKQLLTQKG